MKKKTKMWLLLGGAALAVGGVGYYVYEKNKSAAATPAALPSGTPVTSLSSGTSYKFAALIPSNITDTSALESALSSAGWSNVNVLYFMGTGNSAPFPINTSGYVAQATWNGANGAAVPSGVVAMTA